MMRSIRRARIALAALVLCAGQGVAQEQPTTPARPAGIVNGTITDATTGTPLAGVYVYIANDSDPIGRVSGEDGRFSITNVSAGRRVVRFELIGFGTSERIVNVAVNSVVPLNVALSPQAVNVDPVVVTALGISQAQRSLGYAVQTIDRTEIERGAPITLLDAIASKVAGMDMVQSTGQPGGSARVAIRGEASFRGDGQPLYIIDGVPIFSDIDPNSYDPLDRGQASSRLIDLDPVNIEEISVLRGAAATALYGSRAAFGAIVIRTRLGAPGSPLRVSFNSRVGYEEPRLEGLQTSWAAGQNGLYCNGLPADRGGFCETGLGNADPTMRMAWGPHRDSVSNSLNARFSDPREDFFRTGRLTSHTLFGTGSVASGTYALGVGYTNHSGIMTNSRLDRLNLVSNVAVNLKPYLTSQTTIIHANTSNDLGWEGALGFGGLVSVLPPTRDLTTEVNEDGSPVMFGMDDPHPQWLAENEYATSRVVRWIASQAFAFTFGPALTLSNRTGFDQFIDERREYQNERPWLTTVGLRSGGTRQQKLTNKVINNDLVLSAAHRQIGDERFGFTGLVGLNVHHATKTDISAWGLDMNIPGYYTLSNFSNTWETGLLPTKRRLIGAYSQVTFDYSNWAYLTLSGRNDWSSTLPIDNNSYFSPSASLSVIFTDALGWQSNLLDYGKIRLSFARVGTDAPPYRLRSIYQMGDITDWSSGTGTPTTLEFKFRGVKGVLQGTELGNPNLKPESLAETELGLEMQWFGGRARTDLSLYNRSSSDQIFNIPTAASTGFTLMTENAGDLTNRGVELSVGVTPVRTANASVEVRGNFARNWSQVDELAPQVSHIYLAGPLTEGAAQIRIMRDEGYGVIWGRGYQRNEQGQLVIGSDGFPLVQDGMVLGNVLPSWIGNLSTNVNYRALSVSALLDIRRGGEVYNADLLRTIPAGTAAITEDRNDRFVFDGVTASGQANNVEVIRDQSFWTRYAAVDENLVESANVARLRQVTLGIRLPDSWGQRLDATDLTAYVVGNNVAVWSPFSYGDPTGSNYGAANAGGAAYRLFTTPTTRSWSFGVRASF
jgi:TonB-linked SusC/RagA family outer membrane protein